MILWTYILWVSIAPVLSETTENDNQHMKLLSGLLERIIKVNQKRNEAMKKEYQLQAIDVVHDLRTLDEYPADETDSSVEQEPVLIFLLNRQRDLTLRTDAKNAATERPMLTMGLGDVDDDDSDDDSDSDDDDDLNGIHLENIGGLKLSDRDLQMLRKNWRGSCDKKAAKVCRKACKSALKEACSYTKCRSRLKKRFKKECKRSCKSKFQSDGSRSGSGSE